MTSIPTLFQRPEAVLGVVLAAAALLADFARNVTRLASGRTINTLPSDLRDTDRSIASLQSALDASKAALAETERLLDDALARAEQAPNADVNVDDSRAAVEKARADAAAAEQRLEQLQTEVRDERAVAANATAEAATAAAERDALDAVANTRAKELEDLHQRVADAKKEQLLMVEQQKKDEQTLRDLLEQRDERLESVRVERDSVQKHAEEMDERARHLQEEMEVAEKALQETNDELKQVRQLVQEREAELAEVERERADMAAREAQVTEMQTAVAEMEKELGELRSELRARDMVVNEVAAETDELRSLLAARDAELREVSGKLESALSAEQDRGGDPTESNLSLTEIKNNLKAQELAFSAEISKAELASFEISEKDLDPLDRLNMEMGVEGDLLQAGLRRAESAVQREEYSQSRKDDALSELLTGKESEEEETESSSTVADDWPPLYAKEEVLAENVDEVEKEVGKVGLAAEDKKDEAMGVAKQARMKKTDEKKPRKRRSTTSKTATGKSSSSLMNKKATTGKSSSSTTKSTRKSRASGKNDGDDESSAGGEQNEDAPKRRRGRPKKSE